jgi:hypothetical protein
VKKEKMDAKRIVALFLVAIVVCSATVMSVSSQLQALDTGGSGATVVSLPPEVESVTTDPAELTIVPGVVTEVKITATVFGSCGIDWINSVEITAVDPPPKCENTRKIFPLPIQMKRVRVDGLTRAKYVVTIAMLSIPAKDYTLTVTVTDKEDNTATGTVTFTVGETLAFSVTNVDFGTLAVGQSSEVYTTVTNQGNVPFVFEQSNGIVISDMAAGGKGTIEASDITVKWDWSKVIRRTDPGDVGFTLSVPFGTLPGTYTGMITFTPTPAE